MKRNAFFQLVHRENGVYLQSYPAVDGGAPLSVDDIMFYLDKKGIAYNDVTRLKKFTEEAAQTRNALLKLQSGKLLPEGEFPVITVDAKRLFAKIRLYPPSSEGQRLSLEDLRNRILQAGVKYGILEKNLELLWKMRLYCTDVLIAKAKKPVRGRDARITYHFNVDKTSRPKMGEDGSVDFHNLDMIEKVEKGQLLASLTPADYGEPGMDVAGVPIFQGHVKQLVLKHGKNIHLSEDKLEMYSDLSGNVSLVGNTVFVSDLYQVPGDVGATTGDIDYEGSVVVSGNVLTGYSVDAQGDIIVNGVVEGARLHAGGKIILKSGIQGMQKGILEAQGDVISNFIESSEVRAGGQVITDAILHSKVIAQNIIAVQGKRGLIAGGNICSKTGIEAKTAGSTMGTATELEVGVDPMRKEEYLHIEKEMARLADEKESILQNLTVLKKRMDANQGRLSSDKMMLFQKSTIRLQEIDREMEKNSARYEELGEELEHKGSGRIVIYGIAYPGVKLTIANVSRVLKQETKYSAFICEGADIRVTAI